MFTPIRSIKTIQMRKPNPSYSFLGTCEKKVSHFERTKYAMGRFPVVRVRLLFSSHCLLLISLTAMVGCGSGDFPTAAVTGRVMCEGQPVGSCAVYFEPLRVGGSDETALVGKPGFAFTKPDGTFVISTSERGAEDGAVIGMHRVRVGRGDAKCNCSMNDEATLMEVEVKADSVNAFEIVLPKATAQDAARLKMEAQFDPGQSEDED